MNYSEQKVMYFSRCEAALPRYLEATKGSAGILGEAMHYALMSAGKRVRPTLLYAAADAIPSRAEKAGVEELDRLAAAVEMVHAYSLVHDDLPCMDNDLLRRGKPTTHVAFGEANALLAGDALLNRAFELILENIRLAQGEKSQPALIHAGSLMSKRFGQDGMVGGQVIDLASEGQKISIELLEELQLRKTSALIEAAVLGGAAAAGATPEELHYLEVYARDLGLAFQIRDDILDYSSDDETMGKTVGKDLRDGKSTFVSLLGMEEAHARAEKATAAAEQALDELENLGCRCAFLRALAIDLLKREK